MNRLGVFRFVLLSILLAGSMALAESPAESPLYVGLLIQEDVTGAVATDLKVYRSFIRNLPPGTQVMVGYARTGSNQIRHKFTTDLESAAASLRAPGGLPASSPGSPFQAVKDFVKLFPKNDAKKVLIFVTDGVDRYGPLDSAPSSQPILEGSIRAARKYGVNIFPIFSPTVLTENNQQLAFRGQDSLNYLAEKSGGKAFYSGTTYVSADSYLEELARRFG